MSALKYRMVGQPPAPGLNAMAISFANRILRQIDVPEHHILVILERREGRTPPRRLLDSSASAFAGGDRIQAHRRRFTSLMKESKVESVSFRYWAPPSGRVRSARICAADAPAPKLWRGGRPSLYLTVQQSASDSSG